MINQLKEKIAGFELYQYDNNDIIATGMYVDMFPIIKQAYVRYDLFNIESKKTYILTLELTSKNYSFPISNGKVSFRTEILSFHTDLGSKANASTSFSLNIPEEGDYKITAYFKNEKEEILDTMSRYYSFKKEVSNE